MQTEHHIDSFDVQEIQVVIDGVRNFIGEDSINNDVEVKYYSNGLSGQPENENQVITLKNDGKVLGLGYVPKELLQGINEIKEIVDTYNAPWLGFIESTVLQGLVEGAKKAFELTDSSANTLAGILAILNKVLHVGSEEEAESEILKHLEEDLGVDVTDFGTLNISMSLIDAAANIVLAFNGVGGLLGIGASVAIAVAVPTIQEIIEDIILHDEVRDLLFANGLAKLNDLELGNAADLYVNDYLLNDGMIYRKVSGEEDLSVIIKENYADYSDPIKSNVLSNQDFFGTQDNDIIYGDDYVEDKILGQLGDDIIYGFGMNDKLHGEIGNDILLGGLGNDELYGEDGNDTLEGGEDNDNLEGGANDDILVGGSGSDTYYFKNGDGNDVIVEATSDNISSDMIIMEDAKLNEMSFSTEENSDDLLISYNNNLDNIRIRDYFKLDVNTVEKIKIESEVYDLKTLANIKSIELGTIGNDTNLTGTDSNDLIKGFSGNDTISAGNGNDVLIGGTGNDTLSGGYGSDTYIFSKGFGEDTIIEDRMYYDESDTIKFMDFNSDEIYFGRVNYDLTIKTLNSTDQITVQDWFLQDVKKVEEIVTANNLMITNQQIELLIQEMSQFVMETGILWHEALLQKNEEVLNIISTYYTPIE